MITEQKLRQILPTCKNPALWAGLLTTHLPRFGLTDKAQVARFLAQCGHESGDFNTLQENLNYSADRLVAVFPKYFKGMPPATLATYDRKAEAIANVVYANRMGNGNTASGDGWRYRGRGLIQTTGKQNYTACSQFLFRDDSLVKRPDSLAEPDAALLSAIWFWKANKLETINLYEDVTKRINGGTHGMEDRKARLAKALAVLG